MSTAVNTLTGNTTLPKKPIRSAKSPALDSTHTTPTPLPNAALPPVQAYAKLEGDTYCYYIRTLQVMLGRRIPAGAQQVDIPLGFTKGISRHHARLFYNFLNQRFELIVYGKNGVFVNDHFIEKGCTVPLDHRAKIQVAETTFKFLLPQIEKEEAMQGNQNCLNDPEDGKQSLYMVSEHQLAGGKDFLSIPETQSKAILPHTDHHTYDSAYSALLSGDGDRDGDGDGDGDDDGSNDGATYVNANGLLRGSSAVQNIKALNLGGSADVDMFDSFEFRDKDVKPPFPYASLIAQAITVAPVKKVTLNGIYNYVAGRYPYYQKTQSGWQNSIRHNLSLNKAFIKVPRTDDDEPGKGAFWIIDPNCDGEFRNGVYHKSRRRPSAKNGKGGPSRTKTSGGATSSTPYDRPDGQSQRSPTVAEIDSVATSETIALTTTALLSTLATTTGSSTSPDSSQISSSSSILIPHSTSASAAPSSVSSTTQASLLTMMAASSLTPDAQGNLHYKAYSPTVPETVSSRFLASPITIPLSATSSKYPKPDITTTAASVKFFAPVTEAASAGTNADSS